MVVNNSFTQINFFKHAYITTHCENNEFELHMILKELKTIAVPIFRSSGFWGFCFQGPDVWGPCPGSWILV